MSTRREFITLLGGAAAAGWPVAARAQQKAAIIGFLVSGAPETSAPLVEAFKQGLRENGLVEGKDYVLELRWAEGHYQRFPAFARELVEHGARVLVVSTIAAARAAQQATSTIPIVMASINDPVGYGLVASLCAPWWQHDWTGNIGPGCDAETGRISACRSPEGDHHCGLGQSVKSIKSGLSR
jgi:putative tryptophan/tyrosine transport system substrate-binding protein